MLQIAANMKQIPDAKMYRGHKILQINLLASELWAHLYLLLMDSMLFLIKHRFFSNEWILKIKKKKSMIFQMNAAGDLMCLVSGSYFWYYTRNIYYKWQTTVMKLLNNVQVSNVASQGHCSVYFVHMTESEGQDINCLCPTAWTLPNQSHKSALWLQAGYTLDRSSPAQGDVKTNETDSHPHSHTS